MGRIHPFVGLTGVVGLLSLAGCPPFPGFWSRLQLVTGLLITHQRSTLTDLYELHGTTLLVAAVCGTISIRLAIGGLEFLALWFLDEPFRSQGSTRPIAVITIGVLASCTLIAGSFLPTRFAVWSEMPPIANAADTFESQVKVPIQAGHIELAGPVSVRMGEKAINDRGGETDP